MSVDYATAGTMLETFGRAWATFDGDLIVSMFTDDAEYHADPFAPPMVGHNAIRAYWLDGSRTTGDVEFVPRAPLGLGRHGPGRLARELQRDRDPRPGAPGGLHDLGAGVGRAHREAARVDAPGPHGRRRGLGRGGTDGRRGLVRRRQRLRRTGASQRARPGPPRGPAALRLQGRHRGPDAVEGRARAADRRRVPRDRGQGPDRVEGDPAQPVAEDLRLGHGRAGRRQQGPPDDQAPARARRGRRQAHHQARSATSSRR